LVVGGGALADYVVKVASEVGGATVDIEITFGPGGGNSSWIPVFPQFKHFGGQSTSLSASLIRGAEGSLSVHPVSLGICSSP